MLLVRVNDNNMRTKFKEMLAQAKTRDLLQVAWAVMQGSITRTFREQGYPAGSWPPLAPSTIAGRRHGGGRGKVQMLRDTGRLFSSIQPEFQKTRLIIGSNLKYARIQQEGGYAGRKPPFKKKNGRRPFIPARPYLVVRKEDPGRIAQGMEALIQKAIDRSGLGRT